MVGRGQLDGTLEVERETEDSAVTGVGEVESDGSFASADNDTSA